MNDWNEFVAWLKRAWSAVLSLVKRPWSAFRAWRSRTPEPLPSDDTIEWKEMVAVVLNVLAQALYLGLWYGGSHIDQTLGYGFRQWAFTIVAFPVGFSLDIALLAVVYGRRKGRNHWFWSNAVIYSAMMFNAAVALDMAGVTWNGTAFGPYLHVANAVTTLCLLMHLSKPRKHAIKLYPESEYNAVLDRVSVAEQLVAHLQGLLGKATDAYHQLEQKHQRMLGDATKLYSQNQKLLAAPPVEKMIETHVFDESLMFEELASGKYTLPQIAHRVVQLCNNNYSDAARRLGTTKQNIANWCNQVKED